MKIELCNATKRFEKDTIFHKQSLTIPSGEIVAVLGDNGEGKTTLMECLYGIYILDEGSVLWDDTPFDHDDLVMRRKAFYLPDTVPVNQQSYGIVEAANLLEHWNANTDKAHRTFLTYLKKFNVIDEAGKKLCDISKGQVYKIVLSAFFSVEAKLWLIDEPLASGMDNKGITLFRSICEEAAARGVTIIYSTQIEEVASDFSTSICRVSGETLTFTKNEKAS